MTTPNTDHNGLLRFTTAGSVDDGKSTLIGILTGLFPPSEGEATVCAALGLEQPLTD